MKKVNLEKIIAVAGLPGLFKVVSNGTKGVIVENIIDKKRTIVLNNSKIFSLDTVRIYTQDSEKPEEVIYNLYEALEKQMAPHHKKSSDDEVKNVFERVIPDYDKERVTMGNMRKLLQWYNTLYQANMIEIVEVEEINENSEEKGKDVSTSENIEAAEVSTETVTDNPPKKRGRKKKTDNE